MSILPESQNLGTAERLGAAEPVSRTSSELQRTGLILEGGGMRGVYTSGILRLFMDQGLHVPYVIGVSMGACNGANYVSLQPERNRMVNIPFVNDRRHNSFLRLLRTGEFFNMDFIFKTLPDSLVPFDTQTFMANGQRCIVGMTDCGTGEPRYLDQHEAGPDFLKVLQASCSLPFMARPVHLHGRCYMDGGIADPVPIRKSMADGNTRHILILTQPRGYRKKTSPLVKLARFRYSRFPGLCQALRTRAESYNRDMELIDRMEAEGRIFVFRPDSKLTAKRIERRKEILNMTYDQAYLDARRQWPALMAYLSRTGGMGSARSEAFER